MLVLKTGPSVFYFFKNLYVYRGRGDFAMAPMKNSDGNFWQSVLSFRDGVRGYQTWQQVALTTELSCLPPVHVRLLFCHPATCPAYMCMYVFKSLLCFNGVEEIKQLKHNHCHVGWPRSHVPQVLETNRTWCHGNHKLSVTLLILDSPVSSS